MHLGGPQRTGKLVMGLTRRTLAWDLVVPPIGQMLGTSLLQDLNTYWDGPL